MHTYTMIVSVSITLPSAFCS